MGLQDGGGRGRGRDGRDGRGEKPRGDRERPAAQTSRESKSYRAQLDRLFSSGKIGELVNDAEKARKFVSGVSTPSPGAPQVTVANGKVPRQATGGSAADDRQRESRAGLAQDLARAIQKADAKDPVAIAAGPPPAELPTGSLPPVRRGAVVAKTDGDDAETRLKLLAKLREAQGRDAVTRATEAVMGRFTIPDDWEILAKVLEHRDGGRVGHALDRLEIMLRKDQPRRGRALSAQLRLLEETGDDPELCARAACIRALVR